MAKYNKTRKDMRGQVRGHVKDGEEGIAKMLGVIVLDQGGHNGLKGLHEDGETLTLEAEAEVRAIGE